MFLNNLSSLEIGLLAGGGAILLAVIVVMVIVLCKQCGPGQKQSSNQNRRRRMTTTHHYSSTIDLPPLVIMDSIGGSRCNVMGMIDNPLKAFPCEGETKESCCAHVSDTLRSEYRSHESLAVPRSPREFMYYMRNLEQSRSQSGLNIKEPNTPKPEPELHDVKLFSSSPGFVVAELRARGEHERRENFPPKRKTSGALRNAAYRELMQGNTSFHVVCTTPCVDTWSEDSDSEPDIHDPKARIRFTTILEEQGGSTGSSLNVVSTTSLPPTYHESKQTRGLRDRHDQQRL